jgi:hypothetical protein
MNIASTPFYYFNPTTAAQPTITTTKEQAQTTEEMSNYVSTLSNSDRSFIEFTRCLYKTKSIVQELQQFNKTVEPTLMLQHYNEGEQDIEFIQQYLEESFRKFNHMCKILLVVLTKLESNQPVKRERIDSFRQEVVLEWRKVIIMRRDLLLLIQQKKKDQKSILLSSPVSNLSSSSSSSSSSEEKEDSDMMDESDNGDDDDDDDTSIEPTTTSSSSDSSS